MSEIQSGANNVFQIDIFDQIYCLNLPRSKDRRQYMQQELARVGITQYVFFDAIDKDSDLVKKAFAEDFVVKFPPCFRCGKRKCDCENNVLIAPQVANFLSFQKLWQDIVNNDYAYCLIFEDDIKFTDYCQEVIYKVFNLEFLQQHGFTKNSESLLRLGWHESEDHTNVNLDDIKLVPDLLKMSNPCYMITLGMAKKLLFSLKKISTTSDIFIHHWIGQTVNNYTLIPPIVHDLSSSRGDFKSLIHPKQNHIDKLKSSNIISPELITKAEQEFDRHFKRKLVRDILVVGHPRCGSKYMSQLLQAIGLDVKHESMGEQGISSWMFAVYDENNPWAGDKYGVSRFYTDFDFLIQYLRNPRTAIPSILVENQYAPASFDFRQKHIKQAFSEDISLYQTELEKAIVSFIRWNQIIQNQNPDLTVKVESGEAEVLKFCQQNNLVATEFSIDNIATPTKDINSKKPYKGQIYHKPKVTSRMWNEVKLDLKKELNEFCQVHGYPKLYDDNWEYLDEKELTTKQADSIETNNRLIFSINSGRSGSNYLEDYYQLGQKLEKEKQLDGALKAYQKAIEIDPNNFWYHHSLANVFRKQNQSQQAITAYENAIKINPKFSWSHYHLGCLLEQQGKIQESISAYQTAVELYPNFKVYQSKLESLTKLAK
jgi:tetratricopeptide (TPR) repeat protein/GR25 family glycosyltransferase involved in LPS biosynthesis